MRSYLFPDELLQLVAHSVAALLRSERRSIDKPLTNMALVCRAFYEPAMDARWEFLYDGLRPLIMCLPDNARRIIRVSVGILVVDAVVSRDRLP